MSLKRITFLLVVVGFLALIAAGQVGATATLDTHSKQGESDELIHERPLTAVADSHVNDCAATPPSNLADPEGNTSEVVGWVDGYWYNETVDVQSLSNRTQIEALTRRTAAQVEALRCLTFETVPPIEFKQVEEYSGGSSANPGQRQFKNSLYATLFFMGHDGDVADFSAEADPGPVARYNSVEESVIVYVGEDGNRWITSSVLAEELAHALQDQRLYNMSALRGGLTENRFRARSAVIEGDGTLVKTLYAQRCQRNDWDTDCIRRTPPTAENALTWSNTGHTLLLTSHYHMPLVEEMYDEEGWSGVNALYEDLPKSTAETIDPDRYGEFEPVLPEVPDRSGDRWHRVEPDSGNSYEVVGQHGLTAMFAANQVHDTATFLDTDGYDMISKNYGIPSTNGWTGDRFHAYANEDGDIASVWKIEWASERDATQFVETYEAAIEANDGTQAGNADTVYTFEDSEEYDMAVAIEQEGTSTLIVTAPSVDELTAVHGSLDLPADIQTDDTTPANNETQPTDNGEGEPSGDGTPTDADETDREPSADDDGAGFGAIVATLAVVLTALVGHIRRRW